MVVGGGYSQSFLITYFYYNWLLIILKHTPPSSPLTSDSNLVPSLRSSPSPEFSWPSSFCFLLFCFVSFHMCGAAVAGWSRLLLVSISSAWPMSALPADLYALDLPSSSSSDSAPGDLLYSAALWRAGFFRIHCCDCSSLALLWFIVSCRSRLRFVAGCDKLASLIRFKGAALISSAHLYSLCFAQLFSLVYLLGIHNSSYTDTRLDINLICSSVKFLVQPLSNYIVRV